MPEQTVQHAPDPTIEAMQAIRAIHPAAHVSVELRGYQDRDEWVCVTVLGLPEATFGDEDGDNDYPNCCWFARGSYLNVCRYGDADVAAALAKALALITSRAAVAS